MMSFLVPRPVPSRTAPASPTRPRLGVGALLPRGAASVSTHKPPPSFSSATSSFTAASATRYPSGEYGRVYVEDCACQEAEHIERFWWNFSRRITRYLKARALREGKVLAEKAMDGEDAEKALKQLAKLEDEVNSRAVQAQRALLKDGA